MPKNVDSFKKCVIMVLVLVCFINIYSIGELNALVSSRLI